MAMATNLHEHAVQAEKHLEQLATGLAESGGDPAAIKTVTQMADVTRKIVSALGKGQEQTGDKEPPAPQPAEPQPERRPTIASETANLHSAAQASAPQRGGY